MYIKNILVTILSILTISIFSQSTISGTVVDSKTLKPIPNAQVKLEGFETVNSNSLGNFQLWNIPYGNYTIKVNEQNYSTFTQSLVLDSEYQYLRVRLGEVTNISGQEVSNSTNTTTIVRDTVIIEKIVYVTSHSTDSPTTTVTPPAIDVPTITLEDDKVKDNRLDAEDDDNISGVLNASRDPFYNTAAFTFGSYRHRLRGLDNANGKILMNNIEMNDLGLGRPSWSQWGGLNDVLKNRTNAYGLDKSSFAFGGINGATNLDIRASSQRKQLKVSYAFSNRSYMHRTMATYSSGMMKGDWAVSLSGSYRFADNTGFNDKIRFSQFGTTYEAYSWFAGIDKKIGKKHLLSLNIFSASNKRGKNAPTTQEAMDLAGSPYYNPNWGYQTEPDGKKYIRNAKIGNLFIPTAILMHDWSINDNSNLKTSVSYRRGINGSSTLDWTSSASDPRPDYYRSMPSYAILSSTSEIGDLVADRWKNDESIRQLNWDGMYEANEINSEFVEGANGTDTGYYNLAKYILAERRYDPTTINFTSIYEKSVNDNITFNIGINYANQKTHNYQIIKDLLGAEYYLNINKYGVRDFPGNDTIAQHDLDNPNRLLKEGDKFGYDYVNNITKMGIWGQTALSFKKFDFFLANEVIRTKIWRTGNLKNGYFPNNSQGDSEIKVFNNFMIKGGTTYKINGRNYLFANGSFGTRAPFIRNSMLSPRTRNDFVPNLKSETLYSAEGGYILKAPKIKARAVAYAVWNTDKTSNRGVYLDEERIFGTYVLNNVNTRHWGFEVATEIEAFTGFTITPVLSWGDHRYTSRPTGTLIKDNDNSPVFENRTIYFKGLHVANGPQAAYSLGLGYRTSSYWFFHINASYFDKIYISASPDKRTAEGLDNVEVESDLWKYLLQQERKQGQFVLDASIGKNLRLKDKKDKYHYLNFNLNAGNILNNTDFVTGGFEQYRFKKEDGMNNRFYNKYWYSYGLNFFFGISYRM